MDLYERKDFIQIDYREGNFVTVCIVNLSESEIEETMEYAILRRFKGNLKECVKFTLGAMSAIKLFKNEIYSPTNYGELIFSDKAKKQIEKGSYEKKLPYLFKE